MDILKTVKREETDPRYRWDLTAIYPTEQDYEEALRLYCADSDAFQKRYEGRLTDKKTILEAMADLEKIEIAETRLSNYAALPIEADGTDEKAFRREMDFSNRMTAAKEKRAFFLSELMALDEDLLRELSDEARYGFFFSEILIDKPYQLSKEVEKTLITLSPILHAFYPIYDTTKIRDMVFDDLVVDGKTYPMSYNQFEGVYAGSADTALRRAAFKAFYQKLDAYKETTARNYLYECQRAKIISQMRGFSSVFDYLLHDQRVTREMYDRQIDGIMTYLAPAMRKYAQILKKEYGLDRMTTMDLLLDPDASYQPTVSVEEARKLVLDGLSCLGEEYATILERAFDEKWIDFVNNHGKSTGAFCSFIYDVHPYVLISWTGLMTEAMVLAHELGHAGHAVLSARDQSVFAMDGSMYFIEAPSTTNELIMAHHLLSKAEDKRQERWIKGQIIARTYFHNFVTHFLEAYFQREVYRLIDREEVFSADDLSRIFKETLQKFWGDEVAIEGGVELTWMRQPHYYMGLYPYTYSAGLTIGTQVALAIQRGEESAVKAWLETLRLGGSRSPQELAAVAGVDISTDRPLRDTIEYIAGLIDDIA